MSGCVNKQLNIVCALFAWSPEPQTPQAAEPAAPPHDALRSTTSAAPAVAEANPNHDPCEDAARDARQTLNLADETLNLADDSAREAVAAARTAEDAALEAEAAADMAADDAVNTAERVAEEVKFLEVFLFPTDVVIGVMC